MEELKGTPFQYAAANAVIITDRPLHFGELTFPVVKNKDGITGRFRIVFKYGKPEVEIMLLT